MTFNPEALIGIPHIFDVYRKGNVALLNSPGNGIADDKGIYYIVARADGTPSKPWPFLLLLYEPAC